MARAELWVSGGFWQQPRRSYPWPATRLEVLAARAGLDDERLRSILHDAVQARPRERADKVAALDRMIEKRANGR